MEKRAKGEPLAPELFDAKALEQIKNAIGPQKWAAQYQQNPIPEQEDGATLVFPTEIVDMIQETPYPPFMQRDEYSIPKSRYHADGYSESKKMILEYHGDFWHGNPELFNQEEINSVTKTTYGELYRSTIEKRHFCEESEYEYLIIWESEWIRGRNSIIKLQRKIKDKIRGND